MKVYLAARYESRLEVVAIREQLRRAGYTVTSRWLDGLHDGAPPQTCAVHDLSDIDEAYALVLFSNNALAPVDSARGGKHVEFGYAYGRGKFMTIVGETENVFHHLPGVARFRTVDDFLAHWCDGCDGVTCRDVPEAPQAKPGCSCGKPDYPGWSHSYKGCWVTTGGAA